MHIDLMGLVILILMLFPEALFSESLKEKNKKSNNSFLNLTEQLTFYASMFFLIFDSNFFKYGFFLKNAIIFYIVVMAVIIATNGFMLYKYIKNRSISKLMYSSLFKVLGFLVPGIFTRNIPLVITAVVFGASHCFNIYKNAKVKYNDKTDCS